MTVLNKEITNNTVTIWNTYATVGETMEIIGNELEELAGNDQKMIVPLLFEEVFVNIANYAYPEKVMTNKQNYPIQIECISYQNHIFSLIFIDEGIAFNPIQYEPGPLNSQQIGGHGIRMIKELSKGICYSRENGKNKFTILF